MTDQELLAYAKENYPIGTRYHPLEANNIVSKTISEVKRSIKVYDSGNMECGQGYIYKKDSNLWAPVVKDEYANEYVLI